MMRAGEFNMASKRHKSFVFKAARPHARRRRERENAPRHDDERE